MYKQDSCETSVPVYYISSDFQVIFNLRITNVLSLSSVKPVASKVWTTVGSLLLHLFFKHSVLNNKIWCN